MRRSVVMIAALTAPLAVLARGFAVPPLEKPFVCRLSPVSCSDPENFCTFTHRLDDAAPGAPGRATLHDTGTGARLAELALTGPRPGEFEGETTFDLLSDSAHGFLTFTAQRSVKLWLALPDRGELALLYGPCTQAPIDRRKVN